MQFINPHKIKVIGICIIQPLQSLHANQKVPRCSYNKDFKMQAGIYIKELQNFYGQEGNLVCDPPDFQVFLSKSVKQVSYDGPNEASSAALRCTDLMTHCFTGLADKDDC